MLEVALAVGGGAIGCTGRPAAIPDPRTPRLHYRLLTLCPGAQGQGYRLSFGNWLPAAPRSCSTPASTVGTVSTRPHRDSLEPECSAVALGVHMRVSVACVTVESSSYFKVRMVCHDPAGQEFVQPHSAHCSGAHCSGAHRSGAQVAGAAGWLCSL